YTVKIKVSNPRLPITLDGKEAAEKEEGANIYSVLAGPYKSGESVTVEVGDSSDCPAEKLTFSHTCCDLPCNGVTRKAGYLFWLPEPEKDHVFESYKATVKNFSFEYPAGTLVTLTDDVNDILQVKAATLNKDFNAVVQKWIAEINKLIEKKTGRKAVVLTYEKSETPGFMGTLWIEEYECLLFDFNIVTTYVIAGDTEKTLDVYYTPEKTAMPKNPSSLPVVKKQIVVPAFNPVRTFNCEPERKPEQLCEKMSLKIAEVKSTIENNTLLLGVNTTGTDKVSTQFWEVLNTTPMLSNEKEFEYKPASELPSLIKIRVSVFTEKGCRVTKESSQENEQPN
ncbi:MAG: hypothetical protein HGB19_13925, partial [Chlorobiales bacterium]|nr:hypothetical protein [Chlorobiales bacterium]